MLAQLNRFCLLEQDEATDQYNKAFQALPKN